MKTLILVLIICSFFQSTILPIDLVLIILICRSYLREDRANLFLAFGFGLLNGHLDLITLGVTSVLYLILIQATGSLSKSRLAVNWVLIVPLSLGLLLLYHIAISIFAHQSPQFPKIFLGTLLSLPIFYLIRLWEERFIIDKEIRLKI